MRKISPSCPRPPPRRSRAVGRILKEAPYVKPPGKQVASPQSTEETQAENVLAEAAQRVVTAKRINHVWHVDLTLVPTELGFWTSWLPFSLPQCWPFGYWVGVVIDHFSRRAMGFAVFQKNPDSRDVRSFLRRAMHRAQARPKYLICDKGKQFWCRGFKDWCRRKAIRPRFGAVGQHGSIAVVERFIHPGRGAIASRASIHRIGMRNLLSGGTNHPECDRRISLE